MAVGVGDRALTPPALLPPCRRRGRIGRHQGCQPAPILALLIGILRVKPAPRLASLRSLIGAFPWPRPASQVPKHQESQDGHVFQVGAPSRCLILLHRVAWWWCGSAIRLRHSCGQGRRSGVDRTTDGCHSGGSRGKGEEEERGAWAPTRDAPTPGSPRDSSASLGMTRPASPPRRATWRSLGFPPTWE